MKAILLLWLAGAHPAWAVDPFMRFELYRKMLPPKPSALTPSQLPVPSRAAMLSFLDQRYAAALDRRGRRQREQDLTPLINEYTWARSQGRDAMQQAVYLKAAREFSRRHEGFRLVPCRGQGAAPLCTELATAHWSGHSLERVFGVVEKLNLFGGDIRHGELAGFFDGLHIKYRWTQPDQVLRTLSQNRRPFWLSIKRRDDSYHAVVLVPVVLHDRGHQHAVIIDSHKLQGFQRVLLPIRFLPGLIVNAFELIRGKEAATGLL